MSDENVLIREKVKVELVDLGEGYHGDFNPDDPEDEPLFRFDIYCFDDDTNGWELVSDGSYCTTTPVSTPADLKKKIIEYIMDKVEGPLNKGKSIKGICQWLSHLSPDDAYCFDEFDEVLSEFA